MCYEIFNLQTLIIIFQIQLTEDELQAIITQTAEDLR